MIGKIVLIWCLLAISEAERDGKRWIWDDNSRSESRYRDVGPRYEVFENGPDDINGTPNRPFLQGGNGINGPVRPLAPTERPGGVFAGGNFQGAYGEQNYYPEERPAILTGPIPSWVKEGPFKNFDKCKCTERFNCPSPGISYGHCDAGKQYCCFSINKHNQIGEPLPSRPVHSIENGVLIGPGGPVDPIPGVNIQSRPPGLGNYHRPGGIYARPGANYARPGAAGFGYRPSYGGGNGILAGPGGPIDVPYRAGRSAKKNN